MFFKIIKIFLFSILFLAKYSLADIVKEIKVVGNDRISSSTIKLFSEITINDNLDDQELNNILKKLYQTNFFENISLNFKNNLLIITVTENPIIDKIDYKNIKAKRILDNLKENAIIRPRFSYNEILIKEEKQRLLNELKKNGYYRAKVNILVKDKDNNLVDLIYDFDLGKKAKIKRISFLGNKIYKDKKLRGVIVSSEYKFWKFLTGRKFLNEDLIKFDSRLLTNFYKNNGYYNVKINSSFAKMINPDEFELIFNIDANSKIFFGDISLVLPNDFDINNFKKIKKFFKKIKNKPYSINTINKILDQIDLISSTEQYQFVNAYVDENLNENKLDLVFRITETEKYYVDKINIFGNTITSENVIRNQFEVDEGDPFSEILVNKSINNLKSLNFFKNVREETIEDKSNKTKTINITVDEKPTGEIFAQAGAGTDGSSFAFGVRENNFLGNGIQLDSNFSISSESLKGKLSVTNPNFNNTDNSLFSSIESQEIDKLKSTGYKSNKSGISYGTNFELYDDLFLGVGNSNFYEKISTNSTASARQKAQEGNYWDSSLQLSFNYDKRNQKFQTSSGFRTFYSLDLPFLSDTYTVKNNYTHSYYFNLFEKNISNISFYLESAHSLKDKDIKLSERIKIPSKRLRGFESGRVGPKDGGDFVGGNYAYSINFSSNIPQLFQDSQNVDFLFFTDIADLWGVDYDSSLNDNEIRSSVGLALDWFSPIGPMNISIAQPITKADGDKTETFRFNLGTTF